MKVCVYCAAGEYVDEKYKIAMKELGHSLADHGHVLVFGGGAGGLMGAVFNGVKEHNGTAIGVVPDFINEFEPTNTGAFNITVPDMATRKLIMEKNSDAFIVAPGGIGTFDEFFQCLTLKELKRHNHPIIIFNFEHFYDDLITFMNKCIEKKFIKESVRGLVCICTTVDEIFEKLKEFENAK